MTAPLPPPPDAAAAFYARGQTITAALLLAFRALWGRFDPRDVNRSFGTLLPDLVAILAAGQISAARAAIGYVPELLAERGAEAPAVAAVRPIAFVGASSGVTLPQMLDTVRLRALYASGRGAGLDELSAQTLAQLEGIVQTQVADAARQATAAEMGVRPAVTGWVRMLNPPACGRCAILAGRFYRWSDSFQRHPRCDCRHIPTTDPEPDSLVVDPRAYFDSLAPAEQDRRFGAAVAQAIRDGADIARAVNATGRRAGMASVQGGVKLTPEAARRGRLRLTPEGIYRLASGRAEAIRLLEVHGYINR